MKISILGSNGFLSTALARFANEKGWALDVHGRREPEGYRCDNFFKIDFAETKVDSRMLLDSDIVIYAVGAGIQANLKESAELIHKLNVEVPKDICRQLDELDFEGRFVTFGSVFEMGETTERHSFTEEDILNSTCPAPNAYTVSKREFSRFVSSETYGFTHWHFIIPTIYGTGENPKRLIPYTVGAIRQNAPLHFTAGDQTRQYLHVSEVPKIIEKAFERKLSGGIYNIEGCETLTVKGIVTKIHTLLGKDVPTDCFGSVERADVGMKHLALDGSKLRKAIGFKASVRIEDVIDTY